MIQTEICGMPAVTPYASTKQLHQQLTRLYPRARILHWSPPSMANYKQAVLEFWRPTRGVKIEALATAPNLTGIGTNYLMGRLTTVKGEVLAVRTWWFKADEVPTQFRPGVLDETLERIFLGAPQ